MIEPAGVKQHRRWHVGALRGVLSKKFGGVRFDLDPDQEPFVILDEPDTTGCRNPPGVVIQYRSGKRGVAASFEELGEKSELIQEGVGHE